MTADVCSSMQLHCMWCDVASLAQGWRFLGDLMQALSMVCRFVVGEQGPKQRCTMRTADQIAILNHVLSTLLSSGYDPSAWQGWVEGLKSGEATCQINEEQITITALQQLQACHLTMLLKIYKQKAFDASGWNAMQYTMQRLREDAANAGGNLLHSNCYQALRAV